MKEKEIHAWKIFLQPAHNRISESIMRNLQSCDHVIEKLAVEINLIIIRTENCLGTRA